MNTRSPGFAGRLRGFAAVARKSGFFHHEPGAGLNERIAVFNQSKFITEWRVGHRDWFGCRDLLLHLPPMKKNRERG
jgi:hypothetical protein